MKRNDYRWNMRNFMTLQRALAAGTAVSLCMLSASPSFAYTRASSCGTCHGYFLDSESPKGTTFPSDSIHEMHRDKDSMDTDCSLCHDQLGDDPLLTNCAGCHVGAGLRAHHKANLVNNCYTGCHSSSEAVPAENIKPPYYGTSGTKVDDPCNAVLARNVGENWSDDDDFIGLDNDGDNLYDLADYSCGPLRMVDAVPEGNNLRVRWETAGGRTERIQATTALTSSFSDIGSTNIPIPGVGIVTQEVVIVNGAPGSTGFYKVRSNP